MEIKEGYVYHIKDEYFEIVKDETLMKNHENGKARPTYFCIKDKTSDILWFIPMSSKVEKYRDLRNKKIEKYGNCDSILIKEFLGKESVFLLQNMFPTIEKYVDHVHIVNGVEAKVISRIEKELEESFNKLASEISESKKLQEKIEKLKRELEKLKSKPVEKEIVQDPKQTEKIEELKKELEELEIKLSEFVFNK